MLPPARPSGESQETGCEIAAQALAESQLCPPNHSGWTVEVVAAVADKGRRAWLMAGIWLRSPAQA